MIKHIWKYLTSPSYRFWIDFCAREENVNKSMNQVLDSLALQAHPMYYVPPAWIDPEDAKHWVGSIGDAGEPQKVKPKPNQY